MSCDMEKNAIKSKILIVDDEPKNVKLLEAHLIPRGYEVVFAYSGQEALDKLAGNDIDLVLLDVIMPHMSGFEVARRIRQDQDLRLIPIIMITALRETEERIKGIESGCDDFISKPFDKNEVLARVKTLLKLSFYRQQLDEKEKFASVINEISEGIAVCSSDWKIKDINLSAKRYLNIDNKEVINLADFIFQNFSVSLEKDRLLDASYLHKAFDITREATGNTKALYLEANCDILKNPAGEVSDIVLTIRDITDIRCEELLKQSFLTLISHKLRTPVSVIQENASLLNERIAGELNEKQSEVISNILKKAKWFKELVDKLIEFTTIEDRTVHHPKDKIDIREYLPIFVNSLIADKKEKVALSIKCPKEPIMLNIKKAHLDLILINVIDNAVKFNDKKSAKIDIETRVSPEAVEIMISDNGPGIPPEERDKVFEAFYQSERYFTGNVEGVGLGLTLTKRLLDAYSGQIKLDSDLGRGTAFTLIFPKSR